MPTPTSPILQRLRLLVLLILAASVMVVLVYAIIDATTTREQVHEVPADLPLPEITPVGIPVAGYAPLDSAFLPALDVALGYEQPDPLAVIVPGVPPIGVYLPMTGDTQLAFPTPTPPPVLPPLPTFTATATTTPTVTPTQPPTLTPLPTMNPTQIALAQIQAAGLNCAPAGWPGPGVLTQYYYWYHRGIDIGIPLDSPVVATHSGVIQFAGWRTDGYGNLIILESGSFITYYGHLNDFHVVEGQVVSQGAIIGFSGSTGNSSGPHIHYEIRVNDSEVNPLTFEDRGYPPC